MGMIDHVVCVFLRKFGIPSSALEVLWASWTPVRIQSFEEFMTIRCYSPFFSDWYSVDYTYESDCTSINESKFEVALAYDILHPFKRPVGTVFWPFNS